MVKALVTGGTGFVGAHIVRALNEAGHTVRVLHRTTSKLDALAGLDYESTIGDLNDLDALKAACAGCDWVFHVAAVAAYWRADTSHMMEANVEGTRRVLQAAREAGVKRVVFTSSAAAVGLRDDGLPGDENTPFNWSPEDFPYAYSKVLAEEVVQEAVSNGQDVVTVNPVVVLGPGDLNMISGTFVTQVKRLQWLVPVTSGGIAVVDVRDVARWHLAAAEHGQSGERYILGTHNYSLRDWYGLIADNIGVARPFITLPDFLPPLVAQGIDLARRFGLPTPVDPSQTRIATRNIFFEFYKAWDTFGAPHYTMAQSVQDTHDWYQQAGYLPEDFAENFIRQMGKIFGIHPQLPLSTPK